MERDDLGNPSQDGMHGFPQRTGSLAMNDSYPQNLAFPAFRYIRRNQFLDLGRLEEVQISGSLRPLSREFLS